MWAVTRERFVSRDCLVHCEPNAARPRVFKVLVTAGFVGGALDLTKPGRTRGRAIAAYLKATTP